jgi:hypothetical protein
MSKVAIALQVGDEDSIEKFSKRTVKVIVLQFGEGGNKLCMY